MPDFSMYPLPRSANTIDLKNISGIITMITRAKYGGEYLIILKNEKIHY